VFVKYLPPDMRDEGLYELFAGSGRISSCKVMLDHKTHSSLGYGYEGVHCAVSCCAVLRVEASVPDHSRRVLLGVRFVRFASADEALKAIDQMSGHQVGNKTLLCKLSNCTPAPSQAPCNNLYVKPLLTETTEGEAKPAHIPPIAPRACVCALVLTQSFPLGWPRLQSNLRVCSRCLVGSRSVV
jgi:hypothetical protein